MDKTFIDHQGEHGSKVPTNKPLSFTFKICQAKAKETKLEGIFYIALFPIYKILDSIINIFSVKLERFNHAT